MSKMPSQPPSDLIAAAPQRRQQLFLNGVKEAIDRGRLALKIAAPSGGTGVIQTSYAAQEPIDRWLNPFFLGDGRTEFIHRAAHVSFRVADCETTGKLLDDLEGCLDGGEIFVRHVIDDARGEMPMRPRSVQRNERRTYAWR
jgi:hypothetical protein